MDEAKFILTFADGSITVEEVNNNGSTSRVVRFPDGESLSERRFFVDQLFEYLSQNNKLVP